MLIKLLEFRLRSPPETAFKSVLIDEFYRNGKEKISDGELSRCLVDLEINGLIKVRKESGRYNEIVIIDMGKAEEVAREEVARIKKYHEDELKKCEGYISMMDKNGGGE